MRDALAQTDRTFLWRLAFFDFLSLLDRDERLDGAGAGAAAAAAFTAAPASA